jgi:hypothetical protein
LIVILSLPLDIFFQQIVAYPQGYTRAHDMIGTIPQALTYRTLSGVRTQNGSIQLLTYTVEMFKTTDAFFHGKGSIPKLQGNCPTNNCTWDPYDTLAICSQCTDLSETLQWGCATEPAEWLPDVYLRDKLYPNVTACGYWFKHESTSVLMSGYVLNANGTRGDALSARIFGLTDPDPSSRRPIFGGTLRLGHLRNPIADMLVAGTPDDVTGVYANKTPTLTECAFYWCVNTVQSSNYSGLYSETITNSVQLEVSNDTWPWYTFPGRGGLFGNRYLSNYSLTLPGRAQSALPDPAGKQSSHSDLSFNVYNLTALSTMLLMDEILPAYVTAPNGSAGSGSLRWLNGGLFYGDPPEAITMQFNPWLPPNNISQHMENLATAMSVEVRNFQDSGVNVHQAPGIAWKQDTLVQVRWAWISLPIAVLALSLVFLVSTVVISSRDRGEVGIWKTSIIAVLFNGLGDEVQQSIPPNCSMTETREKARHMKVKLMPD